MNPTKLASAAPVLFAVGLLAACSTTTGGTPVAAHNRPPASTDASTPTAPPTTVSAEDEIRQTVMAFQDAYNTQNWDAYTALMCAAMRTQFTGPVMDYVKKGRTETGLTHVIITKVTITADTAVATMDSSNEAIGSRTVTMPLKLEDGWKICRT